MDILTQAEFDQKIQTGRVVVELYANWCPDCRRIEGQMPIWQKDFSQQFDLLRINRDEVPEIAERYDVLGIPTFLAFEDGEVKDRLLSRNAKSVQQVETFLARQFKLAE